MHYKISGYWKNDKEQFCSYRVTTFESLGEAWDDDLFYYGITEQDIIDMIGKENDSDDFVITSYESLENDDVLMTRRVSTTNDCTIGLSYDGDGFNVVISDEFDLFVWVCVDTIEEVKPTALSLFNSYFGAN